MAFGKKLKLYVATNLNFLFPNLLKNVWLLNPCVKTDDENSILSTKVLRFCGTPKANSHWCVARKIAIRESQPSF